MCHDFADPASIAGDHRRARQHRLTMTWPKGSGEVRTMATTIAGRHRVHDILDMACEDDPMSDAEILCELAHLLFVLGVTEVGGSHK